MEELEALLWDLVELIRRVAPEIWALTVRQSVVEGIAWAMVGCAILVFTGVLVYSSFRYRNRADNNDGYKGDDEDASFWFGFFAVVVSLIGVPFLILAFTILANPQYHAMKKLIDFVR